MDETYIDIEFKITVVKVKIKEEILNKKVNQINQQ